MLEVINGFLLVYFFVLCTASAFVPNLVKPITACLTRSSNEEQTIRAKILNLKEEQRDLSMKDDFAAYSKLQRKIYKLENDLKVISQTHVTKALAVKGSLNIGVQAIVTLTLIISVIWYRREPIVALKGNLFPLTLFLKYPSDVPNAISSHIWVIISNFAIRTLFKPLFS